MIYSENHTEFRRSLVKTAEMYHRVAEDYPLGSTGEATADAHRGNLMAGIYAYCLAAAIKSVEAAYGSDAADEVASTVEDILINGDDTDSNADVSGAFLDVGRVYVDSGEANR